METKMNNKRYIKQIWTETERDRERGGVGCNWAAGK